MRSPISSSVHIALQMVPPFFFLLPPLVYSVLPPLPILIALMHATSRLDFGLFVVESSFHFLVFCACAMADRLCASHEATTNPALFCFSFLAMLTILFCGSHSHWLACCFFVIHSHCSGQIIDAKFIEHMMCTKQPLNVGLDIGT